MRVGRSLSARLTDTEGGKCLCISFEALSRLVAGGGLSANAGGQAHASPYLQVRKRLELESGGGGALQATHISWVYVSTGDIAIGGR